MIDGSIFSSLLERLEMLGALTMSSDSQFHIMITRVEKKSARASTLEFGTNNLSDLNQSVNEIQYLCFVNSNIQALSENTFT